MLVDGVAVKYSRYNAEPSFFLPFSGLDHAMTHPRFAFSRYSRSFFVYSSLLLYSFLLYIPQFPRYSRRIFLLFFLLKTLRPPPPTCVYSIARIIINFVSFISVKNEGKWIEETINDKVSVYWIFKAIHNHEDDEIQYYFINIILIYGIEFIYIFKYFRSHVNVSSWRPIRRRK